MEHMPCFLYAYLDISNATHDIPLPIHSTTSTIYIYTSIFHFIQLEVAKRLPFYIPGT